MKILIIGGSGVIGWKLNEYFSQFTNKVFSTYLKNNPHIKNCFQLDITDKESTIKLISKINPDVVIHTAALTNVDLCQSNKLLADSINVHGTANIVDGCKITKSNLIFVSSSFVFDGRKNQFFEDDKTCPTTYYGITKTRAEQIVKQSELNYLILRTDQPFCWIKEWQHTNSVLRTVNTIKAGKVLKEIEDWYNTPTYVPDFVYVTSKLIDQKMTGIFHVVGSEYVSRYDWAISIAKIFGLDKTMIIPVSAKSLNLPVKRDNVHLNNEKICKKLGVHIRSIDESLDEMFHFYSN